MSLVSQENVVEAVSDYLEKRSFEIEQALSSMHAGVDIIAANQDSEAAKLYVEAKGETSSKESRSMLGKPYNSAQTKDLVADALYRAAQMLADDELAEKRRVAVAFPDTELHRKFSEPIQESLYDLDVGIFWVDREMNVKLDAPWDLE